MSGLNEVPLIPRNGHTLKVIQVCRISGGQDQKEVSLVDQADHGREEIQRRFKGPVEHKIISTTAKGEWSDRPELIELNRLISTEEYDVLFCEDLGRAIRGGEAFALCKTAVSYGVRVIIPHDDIDTTDPEWETAVLEACKEHTQYNERVSKRIKYKLMNRFKKGIGAAGRLIAGYEVLTNGKSYSDWVKIESATPILQEAFRLLRETLNARIVADYFNSISFPVGKYTRAKKWSAPLVRNIMRNTILKGFTQRGKRYTIKNPKDNHRVSIMNPNGPTYVEYPHLAHIDPIEFDEVNELFNAKYKTWGNKIKEGQKFVKGCKRENSRFPGMHARCWYCGRKYTWGANGKKDNLICMGARNHQCWNSIGVPSQRLNDAIFHELTTFLYKLDGFDEQFRQMLEAAVSENGKHNFEHVIADLESRQAKINFERQNFLKAIRDYGPDPLFESQLEQIRSAEAQIKIDRAAIERRIKIIPQLPNNTKEIRKLLENQIKTDVVNTPRAIHYLRKIVPEIWIQVVQLVDGGELVTRATFTISLSQAIPELSNISEIESHLSRTVTKDLFQAPERVRIREEAARLEARGIRQVDIADNYLKIHDYTVNRALRLDRIMKEKGITDPYVVVDQIPIGNKLFKRTKRSDYQFTILEGYQRKQI